MNDKQKIAVKEAKVVELKEGKKYIFLFDRNMLSRQTMQELMNLFASEKITGIAVMFDGDPEKAVKIVER